MAYDNGILKSVECTYSHAYKDTYGPISIELIRSKTEKSVAWGFIQEVEENQRK